MSDDLITAYEKRYQADSRDPSQAERLGVWTAAWNAATQGTGLTLGSFRAWPTGISAALGVDPADPWRGLYDPARMPKLDGVNDYHVAHPDLPKWPEDDERGISPLVKAQGFELEAVFGDYTEEGADDPDHDFCAWLAQWKPAPPAGDHWRLVCIQDTEDGPAALYVRPFALIDTSPKSACHPDDAAVDAFAAALKAKLADARAKGRRGWRSDEPGMQQRLSDMLRDHVNKGDPRDVANFCMFLHQRGEGISVPAPMPRPMETAPRDGTLVRLLVDFDDNATDDGPGPHWTIGVNNLEHDGEDEWKFAGWDWNFDEFTAGDGKPVGWLPLIDAGLQSNEVQDSRFPNGLAEAMNLHDERVVKAQQRFDAARAELERAEIDLKVKMQGRELVAAEYEVDGRRAVAQMIRAGTWTSDEVDRAVRATVAALARSAVTDRVSSAKLTDRILEYLRQPENQGRWHLARSIAHELGVRLGSVVQGLLYLVSHGYVARAMTANAPSTYALTTKEKRHA